MKPADTLVEAQRMLASIHGQASKLWLMTRTPDVVVANTPDIDQQFSALSQSIVELQDSLDLLLDEEGARHNPVSGPPHLSVVKGREAE